MQLAAENEGRDIETRPAQAVVTVEVLVIAVLVLFSLLLRLAELDTVPIAPAEVPNALAAYHSLPGVDAPGGDTMPLVADSPVVFWAQRIAYTLFGHGEASARLLTAVTGVLLTTLPLVFRDVFGRSRAFLFTLLLTFSPVMFLVSRMGSDVIWSLLLAGVGLRLLWTFYQRRRDGIDAGGYAVAATAFFVALLLLAGPSGPLLALVLLLAGVVAYTLTALDQPIEKEEPPEAPFVVLRAEVSAWPWGSGLIAGLLVAFVVSTGFMLYPAGLSSVGAGLEGFLRGFIEAEPGRVLFLPLTATVFYEPLLWVFALFGLAVMLRRGLDLVERFLIAWAGFAVLAALIYRGAGPEIALLIVVPLAGIASYLFNDAFNGDDVPVMWTEDWLDSGMRERAALMGKLGLAFLMFVLLVMFTLHLHMVVRGVLDTPNGALGTFIGYLDDGSFRSVSASLLWLLICVLLALVGYFLAGSVWGSTLPLRAGVIGGLGFLLLSHSATAWTTAVTNANNPVELWHNEGVTDEAYMMRDTLVDIATRETAGFNLLEIRAQADADGIIAWLLRDFENLTLIEDTSAARLAPVVVLEPSIDGVPDLGAAYVGQDFVITQGWSAANGLDGVDFLPWWTVREVRYLPFDSEQITLWVRQDIYDSEPVLR